MKKTIYLIVISIVTVFCIILGIIRFAGGLSGYSVNNPFKSASSESSSKMSGQEILLENFNKINVKANVMSVTILPGDGSKAKLNFSKEELIPEISVRDGVVNVRQSVRHNRVSGNNSCDLVITVPKNVELENIEIVLDVGSIQLDNLVAYKMNLTTNVGSVNVINGNFLEMKTHVNVGSIDVRVGDRISDYNIDASVDLGSIEIDRDTKNKDYSQSGTNGKSIRAETMVGSIKIR